MQTLIYYALTISPSFHPKYCTVEDLQNIEETISIRALLYDNHKEVYERTSNGYLHLHALITMRKNQYRIPLTKHPGFSVRIVPILHECMKAGWLCYMEKDYEYCKSEQECVERQLDIIQNSYLQVNRFSKK